LRHRPTTCGRSETMRGCITIGGRDRFAYAVSGGGKVTLARMLLRNQMPPWRESGDGGDFDRRECLIFAFIETDRVAYLDMGYTTVFEPL